MPRGGAHFSDKELTCVLSNYSIGTVKEIQVIKAGNRKAPKKIVRSSKGKFLLKRRQKGKDDVYHVAFAHAIQNYLSQKRFPVTAIMPTRDKNTILYLENHVYELFKFVKGSRYSGSKTETIDAGKRLAQLHKALAGFETNFKPMRKTFHDSASVRGHLKIIGLERRRNYPRGKMQEIGRKLMLRYNRSSTRVNQLGFSAWPEQIVHGDWHPGNMLFFKEKVISVFDFDSVKSACPVTDLANGLLQFSIIAGKPTPAQWPDELDQTRLEHFIKGYCKITKLSKKMLCSLHDQMIETMIAEAVLPIAATGSFGHLCGLAFLEMIQRKCKWIARNRKPLQKILLS